MTSKTMQSLCVCAITQKPLIDPVVSRKSGLVFEKEAITKHLNSIPYCPVTNQPMANEDLIQVTKVHNTLSRPETSALTYLNKLNNDYDTLVLEMFELKKALNSVRREHSHTLYQSKAAVQVITRLLQEQEQLNQELQRLEGLVLSASN